MKEEILNEEISEVEDNPIKEVEEKKEVEIEEVPDSSGNKPDEGPSFVKKMMDKIGFGKDKEEKKEAEEEVKDEELPEDISTAFVEAAKIAGWTDEEIIDFASNYKDSELEEMIPFLVDEEESDSEEKPEKKEKETPSPDAKKSTNKDIEAIKEEIRKEFQKELDGLKERLGEVDKVTEARRNQAMLSTINSAFDEAGKEFEVFGQTEDLPVFPAGPKKGQYIPTSPQMKARTEVFNKASAFINAGVPVDEAMKDALTWYKGKNLAKDVKRNFIKDLKKNESKLSAKRSGKETIPVKEYEDEEEYQREFIKQKAAELGITLSED